MSRYQATYPIVTMCRLLGVSTSGYYAWRNRCQSKREQSDAVLTEQIRESHAASHGTYGAPRIHADLAALGLTVNCKRVARLMRKAGLRGVTRRRFVTTTLRDDTRPAPDLVDRNFTADKPNQLWVADMTYLSTWAGFVYLAVVIDVFSRRENTTRSHAAFVMLAMIRLMSADWREIELYEKLPGRTLRIVQ